MEIIKGIPIEINPKMVLKELGYPLIDQENPSPEIKESLEEDRKK